MTFAMQVALQGAVGFAIGAGTNDLAIRWLFATVFTKKKKAIAESVKEVISKELMPPERIVARLSNPAVRKAIERDVSRQLDEVCDKANSFLGGFASGLKPILPEIVRAEAQALGQIGSVFSGEFKSVAAKICATQITAYLSVHLPRLIEETDVWSVIYDSVMSYDESKMEFLTRQIANRELKGITIWGGVIGAIVGVSMSFLLLILK